MTRGSIVLEAESEGGGTYTLSRVSNDASCREGAGERLVLRLREVDMRRAARVAAVIGTALAALAVGGIAVALLPTQGAPDGLTPTRGEIWPEALAMGGLLGGLLGGFLGHAIGARLRRALARRGTMPAPLRLEAMLGEHVMVDGVDCGTLRSVESHPASAIVLVVTERKKLRLALANPQGARALAARLEAETAPDGMRGVR